MEQSSVPNDRTPFKSIQNFKSIRKLKRAIKNVKLSSPLNFRPFEQPELIEDHDIYFNSDTYKPDLVSGGGKQTHVKGNSSPIKPRNERLSSRLINKAPERILKSTDVQDIPNINSQPPLVSGNLSVRRQHFGPPPPFQQQTSQRVTHNQGQTPPAQFHGDQTYTGESKPTEHPTRIQDASGTLVTGLFGQTNPSTAGSTTNQPLGQPSTETSVADLSLDTQDTIGTLVNEQFVKSYPSADESIQRPPEGPRLTANDVTGSPGPSLGTTESTREKQRLSDDQSALTNKSGMTVSPFTMFSKIKLEKFKGDGTQSLTAWYTNFCQWAEFYELSEKKIVDAFPFYLESHAKVWYDSLSFEQKSNINVLKLLFFNRFKEFDNFFDLSVLQMKQGVTESVGDYLTRILKHAMVKNIPQNVVLSVAINGLKNELKPLVMTHNPNTMEKLRQVALLAEKSQPSQSITLETYETLLAEIKQIKETVKSDINALMQEIRSDVNVLGPREQPYYASTDFQQSMAPAVSYRQNVPQTQHTSYTYQRHRSQHRQTQRYRPSKLHGLKIQLSHTTPTNNLSQRMQLPSCSYCLGQCVERLQCPARNATCHNCQKLGHFKRACRQMRTHTRWGVSTGFNKVRSNQQNKKIMKNGKGGHSRASVDAMVNFEDKCYVPVYLQHCRFNALLDTGSSISAINSEAFNKLKIERKQIRHSEISNITGAGGASHPVRGKMEIQIKIAGLKFKHTFYIIEDLCQSVILGADFLKQQKACLDWGSKTLHLQEFSTSINVINFKMGLARTKKSLVIPPNSMANIPVKLSRTKHKSTVLLEPKQSPSAKLAVAKCVVINKPKQVYVQVTNTANEQVNIPAGMILATVQPIENANIFSLETENNKASSRYQSVPLDLSNSILSEKEKQIFQEFINKNSDVFANNLSELGKCSVYRHAIITKDDIPIKSQPYRTSPKAKKEIEKQIAEMLKYDIIEECSSSYSSPIVLVKKPNNEYRFAIDYRKLNAVTPSQIFRYF